MAKVKKKEEKYKNVIGNILIYSEKDIQYFHGVLIGMRIQQGYIDYETLEGQRMKLPDRTCSMSAEIRSFAESENITLDDTTMKRIAKFNKEIDIEKLDKQIEEKKKKIDELDNILQDREGRIDKLKNFIKNIYEIDLYKSDEDYWDD
jgi:predicted RNase H-like nuclease (RuvC/YqgF family)